MIEPRMYVKKCFADLVVKYSSIFGKDKTMTDKQIIIDGFNLEYIKELLYNGQRSAITTKIFEEIIEKLERKEQECEELKELVKKQKDILIHKTTLTRELENKLDQLKAENEELKKKVYKYEQAEKYPAAFLWQEGLL